MIAEYSRQKRGSGRLNHGGTRSAVVSWQLMRLLSKSGSDTGPSSGLCVAEITIGVFGFLPRPFLLPLTLLWTQSLSVALPLDISLSPTICCCAFLIYESINGLSYTEIHVHKRNVHARCKTSLLQKTRPLRPGGSTIRKVLT